MSELLSELVVKILADASQLKKELSGAEKDIEGFGKTADKETKSVSDAFKTLGKSLAVAGAAITATMGMTIKSFASTGSELHDLSLKTGVSVQALAGLKYAAEQNSASLGTIEMAIKRVAMVMSDVKDGTGEATKTFDKLGLSLTDLQGLNPEQQFLKIANAIAQIPDPMTRASLAVDLFGRSGTDMLPMLSAGADGLKKMMEDGVKLTGWTDKGAKSADALGDAFGTLKTSMTGVFNAIGVSLVPSLKDLSEKITGIVGKITEWAKANPVLTKTVSELTLGAGGILALTGGIVLLIPQLIKMGGTLQTIATWFGVAKTAALGFYSTLLIIPAVLGIGLKIYNELEKAGDYTFIAWAKIEKGVKLADGSFQQFSDNVGVRTQEQADALEKLGYTITYVGKEAQQAAKDIASEAEYKDASDTIKQLRLAYGDLGNAIKSKADLARYASEQAGSALDNELDKARESYDVQIGLISKLYADKIKFLNAGATVAIKKIQDEIDALDKLTEDEDRALQDQQDAERRADLEKAVSDAEKDRVLARNTKDLEKADENIATTKKDLIDFIADVERRHLLDKRQGEKDTLRASIENIRVDTQVKEDALNNEMARFQQTERDKLTATENRIKQSKTDLETALNGELARLDIELKAKEDIELAKLGATENRLVSEEKANRDSYAKQLADAAKYVADLNALFGNVISPNILTSLLSNPPVSTTTPGVAVAPPSNTGGGYYDFQGDWVGNSYASGGVVSGSIGQPQLAMVHGGETIIPPNESMGGVTVNFTQPVFFDREDTMNQFVRLINKGIQRQERLRFGGAYSG